MSTEQQLPPLPYAPATGTVADWKPPSQAARVSNWIRREDVLALLDNPGPAQGVPLERVRAKIAALPSVPDLYPVMQPGLVDPNTGERGDPYVATEEMSEEMRARINR